MNLGNHPTYRRSWSERHPVLTETIGIVLAAIGCIIVASLVFYAL